MNKRIKKVIALILIAGGFSVTAPSKYLDILSIKAYAATTITAGDIDIDSDEVLDLYTGSSCKSSEKLSSGTALSEGTSYYTKASKSRVTIKLNGQDDNKVRIYKGSKAYENGRTITIDDGSTTSFEIRIYANDYDSYTTTEQRNSANYDRYVIKVKDTSSSSSNDDEDESDNSDSAYLYDIILDYGQINFSKKTRNYDVYVPTDIHELRIKAKPDDDDYDVIINGESVDEDEKWASTVSLNKGENIIKIEVEDNADNKKVYTLHVYRGTSDNLINSKAGEIDNKQDSIYLDDLLLDDGDTKIQFNPKITSYAIDYKESYDYILIKSEPENTDYDVVRINDDKVYTDNYVTKVSLNKGKNVIKIQVDNSKEYDTDEEGYKKRIYTLTIYRGTSQGTANSINNANANANQNATLKTDQWVNNNGRWQYNDAVGNSLKNMWFFDKNYNAWYYLDQDGYMKTGWIQAGNGKWYYLYPSGAMAYNTVINGYKLDENGAWV